MSVTLSLDQVKAIDELTKFVFKSKDNVFCLIGRPGTGKTFVIKEFINKIKNNTSVTLCAPTHKAATVLSNISENKVYTIHQLLTLSPKIDILEFDAKNLLFVSKTDSTIDSKVIICDEASMINDDLFDFIVNRCEDNGSKLIFVGDSSQLQPVKLGRISKVFNLDNMFELTTNHRQGENPIVRLIEDCRGKIIEDFKEYDSETLRLYTSAKEMMIEAVEGFIMQSELEYIKFCKILTYTNDRVRKFNNYVHENFSKDEYGFHELLTGYSNTPHIKNSQDYLVKYVTPVSKVLPYFSDVVRGYNLVLKDLGTDAEIEVFVLSRGMHPDIFSKLARALETQRIHGINSRKWKNYYALEQSFATPIDLIFDGRVIKPKTIDYGYASTIHKSQSSTYSVVYFDNNSLQYCHNKDEKRQLQYVAVSRVQDQLNILV